MFTDDEHSNLITNQGWWQTRTHCVSGLLWKACLSMFDLFFSTQRVRASADEGVVKQQWFCTCVRGNVRHDHLNTLRQAQAGAAGKVSVCVCLRLCVHVLWLRKQSLKISFYYFKYMDGWTRSRPGVPKRFHSVPPSSIGEHSEPPPRTRSRHVYFDGHQQFMTQTVHTRLVGGENILQV